jgi:hypothetical protein
MLRMRCAKAKIDIYAGHTGRGAAWLARVLWEHEAGGSNPPAPTGNDYPTEVFAAAGGPRWGRSTRPGPIYIG